MSNISYYQPEGLKKLKDELLYLEQVERPRVTQEIADARDKGDLSENAELRNLYDKEFQKSQSRYPRTEHFERMEKCYEKAKQKYESLQR